MSIIDPQILITIQLTEHLAIGHKVEILYGNLKHTHFCEGQMLRLFWTARKNRITRSLAPEVDERGRLSFPLPVEPSDGELL